MHRFKAHQKCCNQFSPILCYMKLAPENLEVNSLGLKLALGFKLGLKLA